MPEMSSSTPEEMQREQQTIQKLHAAAQTASGWEVIPWPSNASSFSERTDAMRIAMRKLNRAFVRLPIDSTPSHQPLRGQAVAELRKSLKLLHSALVDLPTESDKLPRLSLLQREEPRVAGLMQLYLEQVESQFTLPSLLEYVDAFQTYEPLLYKEIWQLPIFLKFALLESILHDAPVLLDAADCEDVAQRTLHCLMSLRQVGWIDWASVLEPRILFDAVLKQDPTGTFAEMDFESRESYRRRVAFLAAYSDFGESRVAQAALELARQAKAADDADPRTRQRQQHIGCYLFAEGFSMLRTRIGYHPPMLWRMRESIRASADEFYVGNIVILTILFTALPLFPLAGYVHVWTELLLGLFLLALPASQCAVELVNTLVSASFEPSPLPRLDFRAAVPAECATLVAVPTLLLSPDQVRDLFQTLEVRYLANRDANLHFALLTDLPDSVSKPNLRDDHPLVELAVELADGLNRKYAGAGKGSFLLLHRHRIFNRRQGAWMGWERKRGKLIDLNKLLTGEFDAFPIKAGNLDVLQNIRYVLTLDSDSQLPRGSAASLIGAMAHPLNRAIIDPRTRVVKTGYGILQPRVSVTVHSAIRSRLASIFSGQTGLDIYTRAVSDTYQDLFGEGIFTGKGIYEIETLHAVLNHRFPHNALLSHDLIEGAYARAGLITDVELIDDYPSHYSAYSRRKHRWVRGDWQIVRWIFPTVQEESGRVVANPISFISRWKILDNLRRSLVDPFLFLFLVAGWLALPGQPLYWMLVILLLLLAPTVLQLAIGIARILFATTPVSPVREVFLGFGRNLLITTLNLLLLPHQALLGLDAVLRSLVRGWITGERLLEWETAAQAETSRERRTPVDQYMLWVPVLALLLGGILWFTRNVRHAFFVALPLLLGWLLVRVLIQWLNRSPMDEQQQLRPRDRQWLLGHALRIWHYFQDFGTQQHHWLIPDNVDETGMREAARVSPTNIGLLLNARQAAVSFGFLTLPEFVEQTLASLTTIESLDQYRGHLYNWYDTRTCKPLDASPFVSTVDSGNFLASLLTLKAGTESLASEPVFAAKHFSALTLQAACEQDEPDLQRWLAAHPLPAGSFSLAASSRWLVESSQDLSQIDTHAARSLSARHRALLQLIEQYAPWVLPEFAVLSASLPQDAIEDRRPGELLRVAEAVLEALRTNAQQDTATRPAAERCREITAQAAARLARLDEQRKQIVQRTEALADGMEFGFLLHPDRRVLSIGWDLRANRLHDSCYDMLASEARMAAFLAIARGEMPQQSWFRLSRDHAQAFGCHALMSWTGTMFEYLMPALWMRAWPNTLLSRTQSACVRIQRAWARKRSLPWGISESGFAERNDSGDYGYHAWGIPDVALSWEAKAGPVIAPYATYLAMVIDPQAAMANLRTLEAAAGCGRYGLYEAIDYRTSRKQPEVVREWMAHHMGMSLLALLNLLHDGKVQEWFHANALVQSAEALLNEMPARSSMLKDAHRLSPAIQAEFQGQA